MIPKNPVDYPTVSPPKNSLSLQNSENNMTATPHPPPKKSVKITCSFSMWNSFNVTALRAAGVSLWHDFSRSVYLRIKSNSFQLFHNYFSQLYWIHNCGLLCLCYIKPFYVITIPYYFKLFHNYFVTIAYYLNI